MLTVDNSPFMLAKPDLDQLKHDLLVRYPELQLGDASTKVREKTVAILNTANRPWAIIDSAYLMKMLEGYQVQEFYFSPGSKPFQSDGQIHDESMQRAENINKLIELISAFNPSTLYLRVSPHTKSEFLITLCRICFPKLTLIVEPYDMSCLFNDNALNHLNSERVSLEDAMLGCAVALHYCQGLVVKMGGQRYIDWKKPHPEIFIPVFPTSAYQPEYSSGAISDVAEIHNTQLNKRRNILYAGSASARELVSGFGSIDGANLMGYFERILADERFYLSIINGAHFTEQEDSSEKFAMLLERFGLPNTPGPKSSYRRALTLPQLGELAINFDLGICCAHYAEDQVEEVTRLSIPNRMTTYLNAELPVIIDDRFEFSASLINEFDAGKVIPAGEFETFANALAEININKAREGVRRLKCFFQEQNNKNLASLLLTIR